MRTLTLKAIDFEMKAVKAQTSHQTATLNKKDNELKELVMKRAVYSKTANPIDMANMVYQKITFDRTKNEDDSITTIVEFGVSMMGSNSLVRSNKLEIVNEMKLPLAMFTNDKGMIQGGVVDIVKNERTLPTREIIGLAFRNNDVAKEILSNPLWIRPNGLQPLVVSERNGSLWDVLNDDVYAGPTPEVNDVWKRYIFFKATPGECRTNACVGINTIVLHNNQYVIDNKRGFKAIDFLSYGAAGILSEMGVLKLGKHAKGFARLAQWSPYSRDMGYLKSLWVLKAKFDATDANDGISYVLEDKIITETKAITGIELPKGSLLGMAIQCRPGLAKAMAVIVSEDFMKTLVMSYDCGFDKLVDDGGSVPEFIADENCWKAKIKDIKNINFDVLAPMVSLSKPRFNTQMVAKIVNSELFGEIINESYEKEVETRFAFLSAEAKEQTIAAIKSGVASQSLMTFAPELANNIESIRSNAIDTAAKNVVRDISKINLPISSAKWMRFTGDVGGLFGVRLLSEGFVYAPGIKTGSAVEVVRFPAPCPFEHYPATVVDKRDLLNKIDEHFNLGHINKYQVRALREYVIRLNDNVMMAPCDQRFRDLTGGSDTDADMGIVTWNKKLVKAMGETAPLSIDTVKPVVDKSVGVLDAAGQRDAYLSTILAPKVGVVCNHITALVELDYLSKEVQIDVIKQALGIEEVGGAKYVAKFNRERAVELKDVVSALKEMKSVDIENDNNRKELLIDAMVIAKTINDRTIDSPKTGDQIKEGVITWRKFVRSAIFFPLAINKDDNNQYTIKPLCGSEESLEDHCGRISKVRQELANKFAVKLNELMATKVELGNKEMNIIAPVGKRSEAKSFYGLKLMYNDISGLKRTEADNLKSTDDNYGDEILARSELAWYKPRIAAIKNMGMMIAERKGLNTVQVGRLALHAAATTKDGINQVVNNNFMTVVFPEATMQMADKFYGANDDLKQEIYPVNKTQLVDGEVLVMRNGTGYRITSNKPVAISAARLDGNYIVEQEEVPGLSWFVKSSIVEVFKAPEVNGSVMTVIHSSELRDSSAAKRVVEVLGAADYATFNTPTPELRKKGERDSLVLFKNNVEFTRIRISLDGVDLCRVLHGQKINIVDVKGGTISDRKNKLIVTVNVLGNIVGSKALEVIQDVEDDA